MQLQIAPENLGKSVPSSAQHLRSTVATSQEVGLVDVSSRHTEAGSAAFAKVVLKPHVGEVGRLDVTGLQKTLNAPSENLVEGAEPMVVAPVATGSVRDDSKDLVLPFVVDQALPSKKELVGEGISDPTSQVVENPVQPEARHKGTATIPAVALETSTRSADVSQKNTNGEAWEGDNKTVAIDVRNRPASQESQLDENQSKPAHVRIVPAKVGGDQSNVISNPAPPGAEPLVVPEVSALEKQQQPADQAKAQPSDVSPLNVHATAKQGVIASAKNPAGDSAEVPKTEDSQSPAADQKTRGQLKTPSEISLKPRLPVTQYQPSFVLPQQFKSDEVLPGSTTASTASAFNSDVKPLAPPSAQVGSTPSTPRTMIAATPATALQVSLETERTPDNSLFGLDQHMTSERTTLASGNLHQPLQAPPQALIAQIRQAAPQVGSAKAGVEIALSPEELGKIKMSLTPTEAGGALSILVDRPETLDLMQRHIEMLRRDMQNAGWADVSISLSGSFDGQASTDEDPSGTQPSEVDSLAQAAAEASGEPQTPSALRIVLDDRLDIRI